MKRENGFYWGLVRAKGKVRVDVLRWCNTDEGGVWLVTGNARQHSPDEVSCLSPRLEPPVAS
jgi:hypothetical protein